MRISVTGVDGSGKTSIIRALRQESRSGRVLAFRAPQYHEDPDAPLGRLSALIDGMSERADRERDPVLKTCALFLSMTLYGAVEAHYERAFAPQLLFSERQALADSLAYSRFYKGLLKGPLAARELEGLSLLDEWVQVVGRRLPERSPLKPGQLDLWNLPLFVRDLFELPAPELIAHLQAIYQCELPDGIILLKVRHERLAERLGLKALAGQQRELHEKLPILEALQGGLEQGCRALAALKPGLKLEVLDTSELTLERSVQACLEITAKSWS